VTKWFHLYLKGVEHVRGRPARLEKGLYYLNGLSEEQGKRGTSSVQILGKTGTDVPSTSRKRSCLRQVKKKLIQTLCDAQ